MIVLRDITDRKLTHQNLEALYQEERELRSNLQQEIANRSRYTRAFIHELKTPLTAILSSSELLESVVSDSTALAVIENVRQASLNMEYRINELLDLARADIGLLKITVVPLDIQDLIDETLLEFKPAAAAKNLRLEAAVTALPQVNGARSKLKFVLSNLIANSLQNTTAGEIIVSAGCFEKDFITITVTDTGQGIDPLQLSVIFDPYRRKITEGQKYSGLGVGLALSKLYIELHHGSIQAESAVGKGSRFSFTLPLYEEQLNRKDT
jgi:signal transduction histidine kinase